MKAPALALLLLAATPAAAEVREMGPSHFTLGMSATSRLPPDRLWARLIDWKSWWDGAHSYSGNAGNFQLTLAPGGTLQEQWAGGVVVHSRLLQARPGRQLRLSGGLGPLQSLPVEAVWDIGIAPEGTGSRVQFTYRVAGDATARLDKLAPAVDQVMTAGLARLAESTPTPASSP